MKDTNRTLSDRGYTMGQFPYVTKHVAGRCFRSLYPRFPGLVDIDVDIDIGTSGEVYAFFGDGGSVFVSEPTYARTWEALHDACLRLAGAVIRRALRVRACGVCLGAWPMLCPNCAEDPANG